jgi:hypothetical protein
MPNPEPIKVILQSPPDQTVLAAWIAVVGSVVGGLIGGVIGGKYALRAVKQSGDDLKKLDAEAATRERLIRASDLLQELRVKLHGSTKAFRKCVLTNVMNNPTPSPYQMVLHEEFVNSAKLLEQYNLDADLVLKKLFHEGLLSDEKLPALMTEYLSNVPALLAPDKVGVANDEYQKLLKALEDELRPAVIANHDAIQEACGVIGDKLVATES